MSEHTLHQEDQIENRTNEDLISIALSEADEDVMWKALAELQGRGNRVVFDHACRLCVSPEARERINFYPGEFLQLPWREMFLHASLSLPGQQTLKGSIFCNQLVEGKDLTFPSCVEASASRTDGAYRHE